MENPTKEDQTMPFSLPPISGNFVVDSEELLELEEDTATDIAIDYGGPGEFRDDGGPKSYKKESTGRPSPEAQEKIDTYNEGQKQKAEGGGGRYTFISEEHPRKKDSFSWGGKEQPSGTESQQQAPKILTKAEVPFENWPEEQKTDFLNRSGGKEPIQPRLAQGEQGQASTSQPATSEKSKGVIGKAFDNLKKMFEGPEFDPSRRKMLKSAAATVAAQSMPQSKLLDAAFKAFGVEPTKIPSAAESLSAHKTLALEIGRRLFSAYSGISEEVDDHMESDHENFKDSLEEAKTEDEIKNAIKNAIDWNTETVDLSARGGIDIFDHKDIPTLLSSAIENVKISREVSKLMGITFSKDEGDRTLTEQNLSDLLAGWKYSIKFLNNPASRQYYKPDFTFDESGNVISKETGELLEGINGSIRSLESQLPPSAVSTNVTAEEIQEYKRDYLKTHEWRKERYAERGEEFPPEENPEQLEEWKREFAAQEQPQEQPQEQSQEQQPEQRQESELEPPDVDRPGAGEPDIESQQQLEPELEPESQQPQLGSGEEETADLEQDYQDYKSAETELFKEHGSSEDFDEKLGELKEEYKSAIEWAEKNYSPMSEGGEEDIDVPEEGDFDAQFAEYEEHIAEVEKPYPQAAAVFRNIKQIDAVTGDEERATNAWHASNEAIQKAIQVERKEMRGEDLTPEEEDISQYRYSLKIADRLSSAISKYEATEDVTLYRGIHTDYFKGEEYGSEENKAYVNSFIDASPGDIVESEVFSSFSPAEEIGKQYSEGKENGILLKLSLKKGQKTYPIPYSVQPETIIDRGSKFRIESVDKENRVVHLTLMSGEETPETHQEYKTPTMEGHGKGHPDTIKATMANMFPSSNNPPAPGSAEEFLKNEQSEKEYEPAEGASAEHKIPPDVAEFRNPKEVLNKALEGLKNMLEGPQFDPGRRKVLKQAISTVAAQAMPQGKALEAIFKAMEFEPTSIPSVANLFKSHHIIASEIGTRYLETLKKDGKWMDDYVESTYDRFLVKLESAKSKEDVIDALASIKEPMSEMFFYPVFDPQKYGMTIKDVPDLISRFEESESIFQELPNLLGVASEEVNQYGFGAPLEEAANLLAAWKGNLPNEGISLNETGNYVDEKGNVIEGLSEKVNNLESSLPPPDMERVKGQIDLFDEHRKEAVESQAEETRQSEAEQQEIEPPDVDRPGPGEPDIEAAQPGEPIGLREPESGEPPNPEDDDYEPPNGTYISYNPTNKSSIVHLAAPNHIEKIKSQFGLDDEMAEHVVNSDPTEGKTYTKWIARNVKKNTVRLPEDSNKLAKAISEFEKLKVSPTFTGEKDIQRYTPSDLYDLTKDISFEDLSKKEQIRSIIEKGAPGAEIVGQDGDIKVFKVTDPKLAVTLSSGTDWCTTQDSFAKRYMESGALYPIYKGGKPYAQFHAKSKQFMRTNDRRVSYADSTIRKAMSSVPEGTAFKAEVEKVSKIIENVRQNIGLLEKSLDKKKITPLAGHVIDAISEDTDPLIIETVLDAKLPGARRRLAQKAQLPLWAQERLLDTEDGLVLFGLADNSFTASSVLDEAYRKSKEWKEPIKGARASDGYHYSFNKVLADNSNTSSEILAELSKDRSSLTRLGVARNPNTSKSVVKNLLYSKDEYASRAAAQRTDVEELNEAVESKNKVAIKSAIYALFRKDEESDPPYSKRYISDEMIRKHHNDEGMYNLIQYPYTPADILDQHWNDEGYNDGYGIDYAVARHKNTSAETLKKIVDSSDIDNSGRNLDSVASHPNATPDILEKLSHVQNKLVRKNVAGNKNTSDKTLRNLLEDSDEDVVRAAINNMATRPKKSFWSSGGAKDSAPRFYEYEGWSCVSCENGDCVTHR